MKATLFSGLIQRWIAMDYKDYLGKEVNTIKGRLMKKVMKLKYGGSSHGWPMPVVAIFRHLQKIHLFYLLCNLQY